MPCFAIAGLTAIRRKRRHSAAGITPRRMMKPSSANWAASAAVNGVASRARRAPEDAGSEASRARFRRDERVAGELMRAGGCRGGPKTGAEALSKVLRRS